MPPLHNRADRGVFLGQVTCAAVVLLLALVGPGEAKGRVAGEAGQGSAGPGKPLYVINPGDSAVQLEPAGSLGVWARVFDGLCLITACGPSR